MTAQSNVGSDAIAPRSSVAVLDALAGRTALRDVGIRFLGLAAGVAVLALVPPLRLPVGLALVAWVAYANGANDVSKAIATLVGSGVASYRAAIAWGSAATVLGAAASAFTGAALMATFTQGIVAHTPTLAFAVGAMVGTAGWVLLSSRVGLPVSTTHALTGSIVGIGVVAFNPGHVKWVALLSKVALPLFASPFIGMAIAATLIVLFKLARLHPNLPALAWLQWASGGGIAIARGLNDAPKLGALGALLWLTVLNGAPSGLAVLGIFALIAVAMGVGSVVGGRRVTETLGTKVTRMDNRDGFAASVTTSALVGAAALGGLPVSTTHVSTGAIIGIGVEGKKAHVNLPLVLDMVLAWVVTLPGAAVIAVVGWALTSLLMR